MSEGKLYKKKEENAVILNIINLQTDLNTKVQFSKYFRKFSFGHLGDAES